MAEVAQEAQVESEWHTVKNKSNHKKHAPLNPQVSANKVVNKELSCDKCGVELKSKGLLDVHMCSTMRNINLQGNMNVMTVMSTVHQLRF